MQTLGVFCHSTIALKDKKTLYKLKFLGPVYFKSTLTKFSKQQ